ncbi:MAG TPA: stage II sporulation protein M [Chloroflexi bacterium]|nr:stage II sporulation protein M [Chloroflexota bacterium]
MNLEFFLRQRRTSWQRMETLLQQARTDPRRLTASELNELGLLYRALTADLALAQRDFPNQQVTRYLNQLVGRAHTLIYQGEPLRRRRLVHFYRRGFPQLYRAILPYTIAAFVLFLLPALMAFSVVAVNPDWIYVIEGPAIAGLVAEVERGELWTDIAPGVRSAAASLIMTNNIQVMFLTFAGGITVGLLTLWVLASNGMHLGAIFGLLTVHNLAAGLAEFVVAHGVVELSVIFLAGGCGLYVGDGLLRPGLASRKDVLVQRTRISVQLILGSVPFLVVAGLIEGFLSPSSAPWWVKVIVGILTGVALYAYWLGVGRHQEES